MKKIVKNLSVIIVFIFLCFSFCIVGCETKKTGKQPVGQFKEHNHKMGQTDQNGSFGYFRSEYKSEYTQEQHIQRITEQYSESTLLSFNVGRFEVFLMYSFQEYPEYFLIQNYHWEYGTPISYRIGYIENDEYYLIDDFDYTVFYERNKSGVWEEGNKITIGENPYSRAEVLDKKKYYGCMGIFAWEEDKVRTLHSHKERILQYRVKEDFMIAIYDEIVEMSDKNLENYKKCTYVKGTKTSLNNYKKSPTKT